VVVTSNDRYFYSPPSAVTEIDGIQSTDDVVVVFNQALDPSSVRVQLYLENGTTPAPMQPTGHVMGNQLVISPTSAYQYGARYNLLVHVDALAAPNNSVLSEYNNMVPLFTALAVGTTPTVNQSSVSSTTAGNGVRTVTFYVSEPIGIGQGQSGAFDCIAVYDANLDNGDPANYVGEYSAGQPSPCASQVSNPPAMNVTILRPIETGPIITGFATKFTVDYNNAFLSNGVSVACAPNAPPGSCPGPTTGNHLHLRFSSTAAGVTIRRVDGEPVKESTALVLTIP
jgi:hypothetical protein